MSELKRWNEACQQWEIICLECSIKRVDVPLSPDSAGNDGEVAWDGTYFYVYNPTLDLWGRTAISYSWVNTTTTTTPEPI